MPLYEYRCRACSRRFETLVLGREKPACPKCRSNDLEKLFSAFAVSGAERKSGPDSFGDFGAGSDFDGGSDDSDSDFGGDSGSEDADSADD